MAILESVEKINDNITSIKHKILNNNSEIIELSTLVDFAFENMSSLNKINENFLNNSKKYYENKKIIY